MTTAPAPDWRQRLSPITLGTAQLGMPYGKVVQVEPPARAEAHALFDAAVAGGIACFDTARIYQQAEGLIGSWLDGRATRPAIVSKIHPFPEMPAESIGRYLADNLAASTRDLGLAALDGYLVHSARDFAKPGVADFLLGLKTDGRVQATGISVYDPSQIAAALDHAPGAVDLVQAPVSLFDRRLVESRVVERCLARGVTVFARSAFLQGVLFLPPDRLPGFLAPLAEPLRGLRRLSADCGRSLTAIAIAGTLADAPVASAVIGVGDLRQLDAAIDAIRRPVPADVVRAAIALCAGVPDWLLDPRQWPAREAAPA